MTFHLLVAACPEHFASVDIIKDDSEGLGSGPQRKKNPYLLSVIDILNNISELLRLRHESLLEGEEFNILDNKTDLIVVVIRVLITVSIT